VQVRLSLSRYVRPTLGAGYARRALEVAGRLDHPVYDCLYLALAEAHGAGLATADRALRDHALSLGIPGILLGAESPDLDVGVAPPP
jgi:predicted nucleic acid-binding protein